MPQDIIEVSGTPPLEGKEGFYGSYLHWLQNLITANLKPDTIENNKLIVINLIEIGISMIPDPDDPNTEEKGTRRDKIYKEIEDYYNEEYDRICTDKGVERLSAEDERNVLYKAYIRKGLGSMSTWYDNFVGIVTRNVVSRTGGRHRDQRRL